MDMGTGGRERGGAGFQDMGLGKIQELADLILEIIWDSLMEVSASKQVPDNEEEDIEEAVQENRLTLDSLAEGCWLFKTAFDFFYHTDPSVIMIWNWSKPWKEDWYHICHWFVVMSCPTLCNTMDCTPGFSVDGILQARILEWVAISFSGGSSWPSDWTCISCTGKWGLTVRNTWDVSIMLPWMPTSPASLSTSSSFSTSSTPETARPTPPLAPQGTHREHLCDDLLPLNEQ